MASTALPSLPGDFVPESDAANSEALFANGIDLEHADANTIQGYVKYSFRQYANRDIEDRRLWDAIQADFRDFREEHFKMINGSTWDLIKAYCYTHGYWLDHKYGPGKSRATIMLKAVNSDWHKEWTMDQIAYVEENFETLSRQVSKRKQELMGTASGPNLRSTFGPAFGSTLDPSLGPTPAHRQLGNGPFKLFQPL
ncbi:hypothetical protein MMC07_001694 [Pseudocyphellaria aurata]|nr:hypothetical protein [Pseudocyphellaria aurata]